MEFSTPVRGSAIKKYLGVGRYEVARGTAKEASDYCKKGLGTVEAPKDWDYFEFGDIRESGQGNRKELLLLRDTLKRGASDLDILDNDHTAGSFFKYQRGITAARLIYNQPTFRDEVHITLLYGAPGSGKSSYARKAMPEAYWKNNTKWWPRYFGQKQVIWDEFGGWSCTPSDYNSIFDRYPYSIEVKGGDIPILATEFMIISNFTPEQWWNQERTHVCIGAVTRRIMKILRFTRLGEPPLEFNQYADFSAHLRGVQ